MVFFDKSFLRFFKGLRKNNDREWFNDNKKDYIAHVKEPFEAFVAHMIDKLQPLDPNIVIRPKDAIFRIYRDTRFGADKTPYKEHVSAVISPGGRKDMSRTGVYIQLNDVDARIYSGMYAPSKEHLLAIREAIAQDPKGFKKLYTDKKFVSTFGEIRGEKNKRLPKHFNEISEVEPLVFNKGFYFFSSLPPTTILEDSFPDTIVEHYKTAKPLNDFFSNAIHS